MSRLTHAETDHVRLVGLDVATTPTNAFTIRNFVVIDHSTIFLFYLASYLSLSFVCQMATAIVRTELTKRLTSVPDAMRPETSNVAITDAIRCR